MKYFSLFVVLVVCIQAVIGKPVKQESVKELIARFHEEFKGVFDNHHEELNDGEQTVHEDVSTTKLSEESETTDDKDSNSEEHVTTTEPTKETEEIATADDDKLGMGHVNCGKNVEVSATEKEHVHSNEKSAEEDKEHVEEAEETEEPATTEDDKLGMGHVHSIKEEDVEVSTAEEDKEEEHVENVVGGTEEEHKGSEEDKEHVIEDAKDSEEHVIATEDAKETEESAITEDDKLGEGHVDIDEEETEEAITDGHHESTTHKSEEVTEDESNSGETQMPDEDSTSKVEKRGKKRVIGKRSLMSLLKNVGLDESSTDGESNNESDGKQTKIESATELVITSEEDKVSDIASNQEEAITAEADTAHVSVHEK